MAWPTTNPTELAAAAALNAKAERDKLIQTWMEKANILATAKAEENTARLAMLKLFPEPKEGTNNLDLGNGYTLKMVHKMNYNLSNSEKPRTAGVEPYATDKALEELEKMGNEGTFIAERLVKWSPELSITEYRGLSDDMRKVIDKALTITPGLPSFELVKPPGK